MSVNGVNATPCTDISEPYDEDNAYTPLHATPADTLAFTVPCDAVADGENTVALVWNSETESSPVKIYYIDIFKNK